MRWTHPSSGYTAEEGIISVVAICADALRVFSGVLPDSCGCWVFRPGLIFVQNDKVPPSGGSE